MKECAIVIPCYKVELNKNETIAFRRCLEVLGEFDIYFIAPNGIYNEYFKMVSGVKYYDKDNFSSRDSYSRFMLKKDLYSDFEQYEYILIYQLDAFVFRNELTKYCKLGYDYIGAPWNVGVALHTPEKSKVVYVGNGGFSLRKVSKFLSWIEKNEQEINYCFDYFNKAEDYIISFIGDMDIPPVDVAEKFAVEMQPKENCERMGELPFGCHGCAVYDFDWWKEILKKFEECPDPVNRVIDIPGVRYMESAVFDKEIANSEIEEALGKLRKNNEELYVWGTGFYGMKMLALCKRIGVEISAFVDEKRKGSIQGIPIIKLDEYSLIENEKILCVAMLRPQNAIGQLMSSTGYKEITYFTYENLMECFLKNK